MIIHVRPKRETYGGVVSIANKSLGMRIIKGTFLLNEDMKLGGRGAIA